MYTVFFSIVKAEPNRFRTQYRKAVMVVKRFIWVLPAAMAMAGAAMWFWWRQKEFILSDCQSEEITEA